MAPEEKKEQEKVIKEIEEMTLLKANVKWLKIKHGDMHSEVKSIRIALTDLTRRLFIDEKTGEEGYFAIIKDLLKCCSGVTDSWPRSAPSAIAGRRRSSSSATLSSRPSS